MLVYFWYHLRINLHIHLCETFYTSVAKFSILHIRAQIFQLLKILQMWNYISHWDFSFIFNLPTCPYTKEDIYGEKKNSPYSGTRWGLNRLFWTPLTSIIWTKPVETFFKICSCLFHRRRNIIFGMTWEWVNNFFNHFLVNYLFIL